jgi:hypothetical protein
MVSSLWFAGVSSGVRLRWCSRRHAAPTPRQRLAQQVFHLRVGAAQLLRGEALDLCPQSGIDAQGKGLLTGARHGRALEMVGRGVAGA